MRAADFAERFEISERTVYRDIQALCEVGVPIAAMPGEGYRLMDGYYLPPVSFTPAEARALALALSMLAGFTREGQTHDSAETASDKIRAVLPQRIRHEVDALQSVLRFYAFPSPKLNFDDKLFVTLQKAIHKRQVVRLHYHAQNSNRVTARDVEPLRLILLNQAWLLSGYCRLRADNRVFRLDRIDEIVVSAETFLPKRPPAHAFQPTTFELLLCVDDDALRWVRERQHFAFAEERRAVDGRVTMVYRLSAWRQIEEWLLSWGAKVEVLAPPHVRVMMRDLGRGISQKHQ